MHLSCFQSQAYKKCVIACVQQRRGEAEKPSGKKRRGNACALGIDSKYRFTKYARVTKLLLVRKLKEKKVFFRKKGFPTNSFSRKRTL